MSVNLSQFLASSESMTAYKEWVDLPMTKIMLGYVRETFGAIGLSPSQRNAEQALYYAGQLDNTENVLRLLGCLEEFMSFKKQLAEAMQIKPDYDAENILKREQQ